MRSSRAWSRCVRCRAWCDAQHAGLVARLRDVEVPTRVLAELADTADLHAVIVRNGVVLHAPGELTLGRTTRLANRAQRRALRGLYRCCAIPGCSVAYDRCKLHHIIWWRHGGRTDLDNLLPRLRRPPHPHPSRRMDHRTRTQPPTHPPPPRRQHPHHRPTRPTNRRLTHQGRAPENDPTPQHRRV